MTDKPIKHPPRVPPPDLVRQRTLKLLSNNRNKLLNKLINRLIEQALAGDITSQRWVIATAQGWNLKTGELKAKKQPVEKSKPTPNTNTTITVPTQTHSNDLLARLSAPATNTPLEVLSGAQSLSETPALGSLDSPELLRGAALSSSPQSGSETLEYVKSPVT